MTGAQKERAPLGHSIIASTAAAAFTIWSEGYLAPQQYDKRVGRLYASTPAGGIAECTATIVGPNVILTAGHCVWDSSSNKFDQWWAFVPEQYGSVFPYGVFYASKAYVWSSYQSTQSPSVDYAFLTIVPRNGQQIGSYLGWEGMLANSQPPSFISEGYPGSGYFSKYCGGTPCYAWYCWAPLATAGRDSNTAKWVMYMGCNSGHGASGGPWFQPYNGAWYVASNTSQGIWNNPDPGYYAYQSGPYYDNDALSLRSYAIANP